MADRDAQVRRTPAQVRREFDQMSAARKLGTAADDVVRLVANAATFGFADRLAAATVDPNAAQNTADARTRSGLAGDVVTGASMAAGGGAALRAAGAGLRLARAGAGAAGGVMPLLRRAAIPLGLAGVAAADRISSENPETPVNRVKPKAADPVTQAMQQGRQMTPDQFVTPRDRLNAYIDTVFRTGATIREAQALGGMVESTPRPQTTKNTVLGQTAQLSQAIYADQIAQAQQLGKTDPEAARAVVAKATSDYFNRNAGLVGFDPTKLAQAQLMAGAEEE